MEPSVLKGKLRRLQSTQETINAAADYLIENSADAKQIIRAWNEEFTSASVAKKLTLLYLANDVLQRTKTNAFLPGFLHYLPKATAHLFKHGDTKIRAAVTRLVEIWTERKVLRSQGIAAVKSQLEKVKDTPPTEAGRCEEEEAQGNKRKRGGHRILECLEEVAEAVCQREEIEKGMAQILQKREICELRKEELLKVGAYSEQHCTAVKSEIQIRKQMVDFLREMLTQQARLQEEGLQSSKETLRLCFVREEDIKKASNPTEITLPFNGRSSVSDENNEMHLAEVSSSTVSLAMPNRHGYEASAMAYTSSLVSPYQHGGPVAYSSPSQPQPVHRANFSMTHPSEAMEKGQEREMGAVYHQAPPFMRQGYIPDSQGPLPLPPFDAHHMMHELHSPYGPRLNYGGYPSQYESEKDWRA